jgi:hypothetical protein
MEMQDGKRNVLINRIIESILLQLFLPGREVQVPSLCKKESFPQERTKIAKLLTVL